MADTKVIIRAYNKDGFHKDLAVLDAEQVRTRYQGMGSSMRHVMSGNCGAVRVVVDPSAFPEMVEFEVLCEEYKKG